MALFEYKVLPAPTKGRKAPGVKGPEARFAHVLQQAINELAKDGWEYVRSDILPSEERQGLTSTHTVYRSMLIFRRPVDEAHENDEVALSEEDTVTDQESEIEAEVVAEGTIEQTGSEDEASEIVPSETEGETPQTDDKSERPS